MDHAPAARRNSSLYWLLAALTAGTATGFFLGEHARAFDQLANAFVRLLQMAVLPYVTASIIGGIGALRPADLRALGVRAIAVLFVLWTLALACAFLMPLTFPRAEHGAFFSTTLVEAPPDLDLVNLYIPTNPFFALANNILPAVVLFSIAVGVALIGVPQKERVLELLAVAGSTLGRVMRFVVRLTPIGVFAIAATVSGTMRLEQAERLQLYIVAYGALALLLSLWIMPGLVAAVTPIPARAIFGATRDALVTATIAGDLFIVLPVLIDACKDLLARHGVAPRYATSLPDVILPISYNFPHSGKLLSVSFILFAAWFSGSAIAPEEYPRLALTSLVALFGNMMTALPFLLDAFRVPADTFQLFVASSVINSRFGSLVAAQHTVTVALLGSCAITGTLSWRPRRLLRYAAVTVIAVTVILGGVRQLGTRFTPASSGADALDTMQLTTHATVVAPAPPATAPGAGQRLAAITAARTLRVGYLDDSLPFAFVNGRGELVGFDVAMLHQLARELQVQLAFVPVPRTAVDHRDRAAALLRSGECDLLIGGIAVTTPRASVLSFSTSYLDETFAFVVPDSARRRYQSWDDIRAAGAITIAVPNVPYYVDKLRTTLPQARLRTTDTLSALFAAATSEADAIALPAERGSAWTLRYPHYAVMVPGPPIKIPLALALPAGEPDLAAFVNTWIELKRKDGTLGGLYDYWILGRDPAPRPPRWSVIRDVLHWVD